MKEMIKNNDKPYYQIRHNSYCTTELYVDNVLIYSFKGKETLGRDRITGFIPINHVLLESGTHNVTGIMLPREGETALTEDNAYLSLEFYVGDITNLKKSKSIFHPKVESPWNGLSEGINYPVFELATEIEVELPFVLDGWQNSEDLSKLDEEVLFRKVFSYYQQIHSVLSEHNTVKFLELSKEKMELQEQAFYFDEERKQDFYQGALNLFNQKLEVEPLIAKELKLQLMGYGKLVRLVKLDGSEPLQFKSPNTEEQSNIELEIKLHMRSEEKGLSII